MASVTELLTQIRDSLRHLVSRQEQSSFPWNLSKNIPAGTTAADPAVETRTIDKKSPRLDKITIVSDDSTQQLVGVRVEQGGSVLVPRDPDNEAEYAPVDSNPIEADMSYRIEEGESVTVKYVNKDTDNDHFVKTTINIAEVQP